MTSIWTTLGIARTGDRSAIRRAYAARLKETNPEDDPEGFKALREAYEMALNQAQTVARIPGIAVEQIETAVTPSEPEPAPVSVDAGIDADGPDISDAPPPQSADRIILKPAADLSFIGARQHLEALLKPASDATNEARQDALRSLLASPALESIQTREETEAWLLRMLVFTIPRSDPLIGIARRHFGWNEDGTDWRRRRDNDAALKQRLFARERDVAYLALLASPRSPHHAAFKVLSRPLRPETLWTRLIPAAYDKEIKALLRDIRRERPHIERELNAEAVALWDKRLGHPRLSGAHLWMAVLALPGLAAMAALTLLIAIPDAELGGMVDILLAAPAAWTLGWLARTYLYLLPRQWWRGKMAAGAPLWLRYGWAAALGGVFLIAAGPPSLWLAGVQLLLGFVTGWWAMVVGEPDRRPGKIAWQIRFLFATGSLIFWWLSAMRGLPEPLSNLMTTIAVAAAVPAFGYGWIPLREQWSGMRRDLRRKILIGIAALCIFALLANWIVIPVPALQPLSFAFAACVLLLRKVPTQEGQQWSAGLANRYVWVAIFVALGMASSWIGTAVLGSFLLLRATVNCFSALEKLSDKPRKRPGTA